jgi:RHS repeat-associated protein
MCEARNAAGTLTNQYFQYGQTISGSNYFYDKDQLGSVRALTDSSGNLQAEYRYDPYGRMCQIQGSLASDIQYAGYYYHARSGLNLARTRAFSANFGRWISRDPINEQGGLNLYGYVGNNPLSFIDPTGLDCKCPPPPDPNNLAPGTSIHSNPSGSTTYIFPDGSYATVYKDGGYVIHHSDGVIVWCDENGNVLGHTDPNPGKTLPPTPPATSPLPEAPQPLVPPDEAIASL